MILLKVIINNLKNSTKFEEIDGIKDYIYNLIPTIEIMFDFDQQNSAHQYDLWKHTVYTILGLPRGLNDDMLYLAALLHDIGKPDCQCNGKTPEDKNKHYHGHQKKSMEIVRDEVVPFLKEKHIILSDEDVKRLLFYIEHHDDMLYNSIDCINKYSSMESFLAFKNLVLLELADAKAHVMIPVVQKRVEVCEKLLKMVSGEDNIRKIISEGK